MPTTYYIWDEVNDTLLMEKDEAGNTIAEYTHEPGQHGPLISQHRNGETQYHHFDGQGSTRQLTDANGIVTDSRTYTAFGETVASSGTTTNPFGYKGALGYYANPETNDLYVRTGIYEPSIARWASRDDIGFQPGDTNRLGYAEQNPLTIVNPRSSAPLMTLDSIGRAFLAALVPVSPVACGSVCGGQYYGDALPGGTPAGESGFREGMYFGLLWVDNGTCPGPRVHVKLVYTTLTVLQNRIECEPNAEGELLTGRINPKASFRPSDRGCSFLDNGSVTLRSGIPPDCSFVTFQWDCPTNCLRLFEMVQPGDEPTHPKVCATPAMTTEVRSGTRESYWIRQDVQFRDRCCKTWPCSATFEFKERIGDMETAYGCWDFRDPGLWVPR